MAKEIMAGGLPDSLDKEPEAFPADKTGVYIAAGLPERLEDEKNNNGLPDKLKRSMKDRIDLFKKDFKQGLKETHRDIAFGHMDNCTDVYELDSKELEDCIVKAIRKDALTRNPIGILPNFISSQKEKKKMLDELEKNRNEKP